MLNKEARWCFILTKACFSFVVLNEEADGDCLQHDEQRLAPSTKSRYLIRKTLKKGLATGLHHQAPLNMEN